MYTGGQFFKPNVEYCEANTCLIKKPGCSEAYPGDEIKIETNEYLAEGQYKVEQRGVKITFKQNVENGWAIDVCLQCFYSFNKFH